jgi:hypothetical protein
VFLSWEPADRDKAIWWLLHERQRCSECGTRPDEWKDNKDAYVAEPVHCRGCEVSAQGADWLERHKKQVRRGTRMTLRLNTPEDADAHWDDSDNDRR